MAPQVGLEPTLDTLEECCLSLRLLRYGALPPTRTGNTLLLREPRLPIAPEGHCLVLPPGIEPGSTVLQTAAMTTSAKVANKTGCIFTVLIKSQMYNFCC